MNVDWDVAAGDADQAALAELAALKASKKSRTNQAEAAADEAGVAALAMETQTDSVETVAGPEPKVELTAAKKALNERFESLMSLISNAKADMNIGLFHNPGYIKQTLDSEFGRLADSLPPELEGDYNRLAQQLWDAMKDHEHLFNVRSRSSRAAAETGSTSDQEARRTLDDVRTALKEESDLYFQIRVALNESNLDVYEKLWPKLLEIGENNLKKLQALPDSVDRNMLIEHIVGGQGAVEALKHDYDRIVSIIKPEREDKSELTPEEKLAEAREKFLKAEKRIADAEGILKKLTLRKASREKIEKEMEEAEAEYKKLRAEYVGANVDRYLGEQTKLTEQRLDKFAKEKNAGRKAYDAYKKLADYNADWLLQKAGVKVENRFAKAVLRTANARTLTSALLLGGGLYAGATATGLGIMAARRLLSGTSSGIGSYDLLNYGRGRLDERAIRKDLKTENIDTIQDYILRIESRALLDGKTLDFLQKNNELYRELTARRDQMIKADAEGVVDEKSLAKALDNEFDKSDWKLGDKFAKERSKRRKTAVAAALLGTVVGSGSYLFNKAFGHSEAASTAQSAEALPKAPRPPEMFQPEPIKPPTPPEFAGSEPIEPLKPSIETGDHIVAGEGLPPESAETSAPIDATTTAPSTADAAPSASGPAVAAEKLEMRSGATLEMKGEIATVSAGSRGIEGALLDLKDVNEETYGRMIAKLHETYPDFKGNDGSLIHKFVNDFAKEQGYTVDGGGKDLSRVFGAGIEVGPDGTITLPTEHIDFMPEKPPMPTADAVATDVEAAEAPTAESPFRIRTDFTGKARPKNLFANLSNPEAASDATSVPAELSEKLAQAQELASNGKFGQGLDLLLGENQNRFFDYLELKPRDIGSITAKDWTIAEFLDRHAQGYYVGRTNHFASLIKGLAGENSQILDSHIREQILKLADQYSHLDAAREAEAYSVAETGKLSDAISLLLSEKHGEFLKNQFGISPRSLNKIQNLTVGEFMDQRSGGVFGHPYDKFSKVANKMADAVPEVRALSIKTFILDYAKEWKKWS